VALSIAQLLPNRALVHGKIIRPVKEWRSLACGYCTSEALLMNTSAYVCMSVYIQQVEGERSKHLAPLYAGAVCFQQRTIC
jgi:hypothetical protein